MIGRFRLTIFIALCILACAFAAKTTGSSSYPKVHRRRVVGSSGQVSSHRIGESQSSNVNARSVASNSGDDSASKPSQTGNLLKVAKALARSHSTSEVLTLNLTNLLILIVLKAVIFGIGLFYFGGVSFKGGHGGGHGNGWSSRSLDGKKSSSIMTEGELMLMLTYLLGASNDNYECMYRVACEDPSKAKEYLNVSKMIIKGAKFMKK